MKLPAIIQTPIDVVRALFGSLLGIDAAHYPRKAGSGKYMEPAEMLEILRNGFGDFRFKDIDETDHKLLLDRAKDSLEEARKQTEYQDAKAGRLLTIVAFLTAAIGTVFGKFVDLYPLHNGQAPVSETSNWVTTTYGLFGLYLLLVAAGALVTFHAMSPRFVWPNGKDEADKDDVESLLFFKQVIRTRPEAWAKKFAGDRGELLRTYYKNYASEAYLISAKVADKLRYLDPGQRLLIWSIRVLLALFISLILTFVKVAPPPKASVETVRSGVLASGPPAAPSGSSVPALATTPAPNSPPPARTSEKPQPAAAPSQDATPVPGSSPKPTPQPSP